MDKTTSIIRDLVEALMEAAPGHPAIRGGIDWLTTADKVDVDVAPARTPRKSCRNCGEEFFFANRFVEQDFKSLTTQYKTVWVPICPLAIRSGDVILDAVGLDWVNPANPKYPIIVDAAPGVQWIPHSVLCGMVDRPEDPDLANIWDQTTGTLVADRMDAISDLLELLEDTDG